MNDSRCGRWSLVSSAEQERVAIPLRCRRWDCPLCKAGQQRKLIRRSLAGHPNRLATLTCSVSHFPDATAAYTHLAAALTLLVKRIRRLQPAKPFEYLAIFESTQQGWPHLHLLIRGPRIPQRWLSDQWRELAYSPVVDIRLVRGEQHAARYVAKYTSKDPDAPKGIRRFRVSNHFCVAEVQKTSYLQPAAHAWQLARCCLEELKSQWEAEGFFAVLIGPNHDRLQATDFQGHMRIWEEAVAHAHGATAPPPLRPPIATPLPPAPTSQQGTFDGCR